jgi:hypothetical protein
LKTFKLYNKYKLYGIHNSKEEETQIQPTITPREMSNAKIVIPGILPMGNVSNTDIGNAIINDASTKTITNITKLK